MTLARVTACGVHWRQRFILSLAVGLLLQGLPGPQGADWGYVAQEALQMLLQGPATGQ